MTITISCDRELGERIAREAKRLHLNKSSWVRMILGQKLDDPSFSQEPVEQPPAPAKGAAQGPTRITKPTKYPPSAAPDHLNEK